MGQVNFSPPGLCYKCLTILYWCILQECLTMDSASDLILSLFKISLLNQCKVKGRLLYHTYVSTWFQYYITVKDYLDTTAGSMHTYLSRDKKGSCVLWHFKLSFMKFVLEMLLSSPKTH